MKNKIKKVAILTSGGDAPGMNAAVRAVAKSAKVLGIEPYVIFEGYKGLVENQIFKADLNKLDQNLENGGTLIYSARYPDFVQLPVRQKAVKNLQALNIDALVVIGGDGSYKGAQLLADLGINTVGLPGTIDNDIASSDFTIGFFSALNTIVEQVERVRTTAKSHKRAMIIEVMGRYAGDLALYSGIATGPALISISEKPKTETEIITAINNAFKNGKDDVLVIVTENIYNVEQLAKKIEQQTGHNTRAVVLGHTQRGGTPAAMDRVLATLMGMKAIEFLASGKSSICVSYQGGQLVAIDIQKALNQKRQSLINLAEKINKLNE